MYKPGAKEDNVQMSDVLCDFCHSEWTDERPMVEGHRGAMICGTCLRAAYLEVVSHDAGEGTESYHCTMCREGTNDRLAIDRSDRGWISPAQPEAAICRRCIKQAAGVLHKDPDYGWRKPQSDEDSSEI